MLSPTETSVNKYISEVSGDDRFYELEAHYVRVFSNELTRNIDLFEGISAPW